MNEKIILGVNRQLVPLPPTLWKQHLANAEQNAEKRLSFMSPDHHRVRDFVVIQLPKIGKPLSPALISNSLDLPLTRVQEILLELEQHMTFLFRNESGYVTWAYPVTVDPTPHQVTFSTGETIYAA